MYSIFINKPFKEEVLKHQTESFEEALREAVIQFDIYNDFTECIQDCYCVDVFITNEDTVVFDTRGIEPNWKDKFKLIKLLRS